MKDYPLWKMMLASWGITFFEYLLIVPANPRGARAVYSAPQLKGMQEALTRLVFVGFRSRIWDSRCNGTTGPASR